MEIMVGVTRFCSTLSWEQNKIHAAASGFYLVKTVYVMIFESQSAVTNTYGIHFIDSTEEEKEI